MSDMKYPIRPAPEPPKIRWPNQNGTFSKESSNIGDPFLEGFKLSRSQSVGKLGENKKPPPRPPPPPTKLLSSSKSSISATNRKQSNQLLSTLFIRNKSVNTVPKSQTFGSFPDQSTIGRQTTTPCGMLIDLSSPPSSPTLTAHSSSDGFSINSFGSDGLLTGFNNASSQIESGFEDDFDLLMVSSATSPDPWANEHFGNARQSSQTSIPFELSNEDPRCRYKVTDSTSVSTTTKPTIIRPKNSKPARPPPPKLRPSSTPPTFVSFSSDVWSPPMPSCPPPPPPPEIEQCPSLPPRPSTLIQEGMEKKKPYCIALYDYDAGHPDDLSFSVNDVIHLTGHVNNEWLRGRLNGKQGMFPACYTNIVVPLDSSTEEQFKYVIALYTFRPEIWDDLPFEEGDTVKVTRRINDHWLFGECNGRQGQFPENYVTDVSSFFPLQFAYT